MHQGIEFLDYDEHMRRHNMKTEQNAEPNIALQAREILEEKINEKIAEYPSSLKPKHLQEILSNEKGELYSKTQVYELLNNKKIPGAKKIEGMGWRIPALTFFAWWYGNENEEVK